MMLLYLMVSDEEGTFTWTWLMDYDKHNGHAIPVKYTYLLDACEDYRRRELHFTYQPLREEETSFNVDDYCS